MFDTTGRTGAEVRSAFHLLILVSAGGGGTGAVGSANISPFLLRTRKI